MPTFTRFRLARIEAKFYTDIYKVCFGGNRCKVLCRHLQGLVWFGGKNRGKVLCRHLDRDWDVA
jgi:hypothetical protein